MNRSRSNRPTRFTLAMGAAAALGAICLSSPDANADSSVSVHLGGSASVSAGVHVNVDAVAGALATLEAGLAVGIGFSEPPPPPPPPVPTYYVEPEPIYVPPQPVYVQRPMMAPVPRLRRWGVGAFAGSVDAEGQDAGSDLGLLGRYRLSTSWAVEAELAKTEAPNGARVDRRLGGALIWNLPLGNRLKPSLLLGAGYGQSEFGPGELHAQQGYGEVGAGLSYALSRSFHIMGDVRAGTRSTSDDVMYVAKGGVVQLDEEEDYSRARIGAMIFF